MPLCKTYYVNAETGRDSFDGLSEATAFASLRAVNRLTLQPGDRVRLACGSVFAGQYLHLTCCGSKDAPIVVGAYGDGLPRALTPTGRASGTRIMAARWTAPPMCTGAMFPRPCCCTMPRM